MNYVIQLGVGGRRGISQNMVKDYKGGGAWEGHKKNAVIYDQPGTITITWVRITIRIIKT